MNVELRIRLSSVLTSAVHLFVYVPGEMHSVRCGGGGNASDPTPVWVRLDLRRASQAPGAELQGAHSSHHRVPHPSAWVP